MNLAIYPYLDVEMERCVLTHCSETGGEVFELHDTHQTLFSVTSLLSHLMSTRAFQAIQTPSLCPCKNNEHMLESLKTFLD